ncbi:MAG: LamG domain-containing protein [Sedimentisphaerales bacterium]
MFKKLIYFACILLVLSLASNSMAELAAYYSLDEGAGDAVADGSGNGHDGTISGNPTWVNGPPGYGTAVQFGTEGSQPIDCGMWDNTLGTGEMTLACWVKFSTGGSEYQGILANRTAYDVEQMYWALEIMGDSGSFYFGSLNGSAYGLGNVTVDEWTHVAVTFDGSDVVGYIDGEQSGTGSPAYGNAAESTVRIGASEAGGNLFEGAIDEVYFFSGILSPEEIVSVMNGEIRPTALNPEKAKSPEPENEDPDVPRDIVLGWKPGIYAATHNLFIGTDFNDVNDATAANPLSADFIEGLDANTYDPGRLEFGTIYYWRVDEVNAPSTPGTWTGETWSFTVEPVGYKVPASDIKASASGSYGNYDPNDTINEVGLVASNMDLHLNAQPDMWLSNPGAPNSVWIQYDFDKVYKLHQMLVWNYNYPMLLKAGFKDVTVE